jgi:hypothetical protein
MRRISKNLARLCPWMSWSSKAREWIKLTTDSSGSPGVSGCLRIVGRNGVYIGAIRRTNDVRRCRQQGAKLVVCGLLAPNKIFLAFKVNDYVIMQGVVSLPEQEL